MSTTAISDAADRVLLSGRIRHCTLKLYFGRASLYFDRLEVKGWTWRGPVREIVALDGLTGVDWWTLTTDGPNLSFLTNNGARIAFWVKSPGVWRFRIQELMSPDNPSAVSSKRARLVSAA